MDEWLELVKWLKWLETVRNRSDQIGHLFCQGFCVFEESVRAFAVAVSYAVNYKASAIETRSLQMSCTQP